MANQSSKPGGSFLGKGDLKFNAAGDNAPMPGEKVAETPRRPLFGGPRVWIGVVVIVVAMVLLFVLYETHPGESTTANQRPGVNYDNATNDNPDKN
jgi:hypothetical protein